MAIVFTPANRPSALVKKLQQEIADKVTLSPKVICPLYAATTEFFRGIDPENKSVNTLHSQKKNKNF